MRKVLIALAISAAAIAATPAYANETRVEARGGVVWFPGDSQGTLGVALGYDFDLASSAFAGVEVSGDKILEDGTKVSFGVSGRLGLKAGTSTKIYAAGGYHSEPCDLCQNGWSLGGGIQQNVAPHVYIKAEYRHIFVSDYDDWNTLVGGVGLTF